MSQGGATDTFSCLVGYCLRFQSSSVSETWPFEHLFAVTPAVGLMAVVSLELGLVPNPFLVPYRSPEKPPNAFGVSGVLCLPIILTLACCLYRLRVLLCRLSAYWLDYAITPTPTGVLVRGYACGPMVRVFYAPYYRGAITASYTHT
jgi:hypothetical protein